MRVADLSAGYAPGAVVLRGVSFALEGGTIAAVLGPNGGGKTTLFRALLGELPLRRGRVELPGPPAYVPQTEHARLDFPVSALDAVGALLVTVVLVVPAATVRLCTDRLSHLRRGAIALAAVEGVAAVWLADTANVGAGPAFAVLGGAIFAAVAIWRRTVPARRRAVAR